MHVCEEGERTRASPKSHDDSAATNQTRVEYYIILAQGLMDLASREVPYFTSGLLRRLSNGPMDLKDRKAIRVVVCLRDVEGDSSLSYERRVLPRSPTTFLNGFRPVPFDFQLISSAFGGAFIQHGSF